MGCGQHYRVGINSAAGCQTEAAVLLGGPNTLKDNQH